MDGDVILVFSRHTGGRILSPEELAEDDQEFVQFAKVDSNYDGPLAEVEELSDTERLLHPLSSHVVRMWDYEDVPELIESSYSPPTCSPAKSPATKIAGVPYWPQVWDGHVELGVDERYLAQIGSVGFLNRVAWPLFGIEELQAPYPTAQPLKIAEYGCMHIWQDKRGFLWDYQC